MRCRQGGAEDPPLHDGSLMTDEERDEGKVNWHVYWRYIREGGLILITLTVLCTWGGEAMSQLQQVPGLLPAHRQARCCTLGTFLQSGRRQCSPWRTG